MTVTRKIFTEVDKEKLKDNLREICCRLWLEQGYKETSISEFCKKSKISTGTFYNLYSSKEDLFFETLEEVQNKVNQTFISDIKQEPTKEGFVKSLENLYVEYESKPFLYDVKTIDFLSFYNKLPDDKKSKLENDNSDFFRQAIAYANLKLNVSEQIAFSVFTVVLSAVSSKNMLSKSCDFKGAFQFMVRSLVQDIFI